MLIIPKRLVSACESYHLIGIQFICFVGSEAISVYNV